MTQTSILILQPFPKHLRLKNDERSRYGHQIQAVFVIRHIDPVQETDLGK